MVKVWYGKVWYTDACTVSILPGDRKTDITLFKAHISKLCVSVSSLFIMSANKSLLEECYIQKLILQSALTIKSLQENVCLITEHELAKQVTRDNYVFLNYIKGSCYKVIRLTLVSEARSASEK